VHGITVSQGAPVSRSHAYPDSAILLFPGYKPVRDATGDVKPDDVALGADPGGSGSRRARGIDGCEGAPVEHEAMADTVCNVVADDIALRVDT
jgi:hypothetical protein